MGPLHDNETGAVSKAPLFILELLVNLQRVGKVFVAHPDEIRSAAVQNVSLPFGSLWLLTPDSKQREELVNDVVGR